MTRDRNSWLAVQWLILPISLALSGCGSINFNPSQVTVDAGSSAQVSVTTGNSAPLTATLTPAANIVGVGGQPAGANAALTIPAQGPATETVKGFTAGHTNVVATAPGTGTTYQWSGSFGVTVNPTLSSVLPANGQTGSAVALTGIGFIPGVTTVVYTPSGGAALPSVTPNPGGTSTTLTAALPATAGAYGVQVQTTEASTDSNSQPITISQLSQSIPYIVTQQTDPRTPGAFVPFGSLSTTSPPTCGAFNLTITPGTSSATTTGYYATFSNASTGAKINPSLIQFSTGNSPTGNAGAGFSPGCNVGVVWGSNTSAQEYYKFLILANGTPFPATPPNSYVFSTQDGAGQYIGAFPAQLWSSPDNSIIMVVSGGGLNQNFLTVQFFDVYHGGKSIGTAQLSLLPMAQAPTFTAIVTTNGLNVAITQLTQGSICTPVSGSSSCGAIPIP
jgi:hypothetical protein